MPPGNSSFFFQLAPPRRQSTNPTPRDLPVPHPLTASPSTGGKPRKPPMNKLVIIPPQPRFRHPISRVSAAPASAKLDSLATRRHFRAQAAMLYALLETMQG